MKILSPVAERKIVNALKTAIAMCELKQWNTEEFREALTLLENSVDVRELLCPKKEENN